MLVSPERIAGFGDLVSKRTGESSVYWNRAESAFYKVKNPAAKAPIKRTLPEDWLYEHVIHNILFPESAYDFVGILEECGGVRIVLRQRAVKTESFPEEEQVAVALADRGLFPADRYFFGDGVVSVTDVGAHGDNVLLDDAGNVRFIDPLIRLEKPAEDVIEWLTGYNPTDDRNRKTNGFTLIELLVIVAILATMVTIGVGSIASGQGAARVKGATRDVYAAIRHARSTALVTGQRIRITYYEEKIDSDGNQSSDGEYAIRMDVVGARIMNVQSESYVEPYCVEEYKEIEPHYLAEYEDHPRAGETSSNQEEGETIEEILF